MKQKLLLLWQTASVLNVLAVVLMSAALALAGLAGSYWVKRHSLFNIKEVVVTGMRGEQDLLHQNPTFIRQVIVRQLRGNLMTVQLDAVQSTFAQAPWIRHVHVRRVWPNRLWVVLEEHQAVASLNDEFLVNQQGETYMAVVDDAMVGLPALIGKKQDASLMLERFRELNGWLVPSQLTVHQLYLSERRAWTAVLSNQTTLEIGRDDLKPSVSQRVSQWAKTWATAQNAAGVSKSLHIDLRYPNGYAISRSAS
jgi:cell division protein FtsQ